MGNRHAQGEILGLIWVEVNLHENLLTLKSEDTKTKQRWIILISGRLWEMLLTYVNGKAR
jgi:hypothetical protein